MFLWTEHPHAPSEARSRVVGEVELNWSGRIETVAVSNFLRILFNKGPRYFVPFVVQVCQGHLSFPCFFCRVPVYHVCLRGKPKQTFTSFQSQVENSNHIQATPKAGSIQD